MHAQCRIIYQACVTKIKLYYDIHSAWSSAEHILLWQKKKEQHGAGGRK